MRWGWGGVWRGLDVGERREVAAEAGAAASWEVGAASEVPRRRRTARGRGMARKEGRRKKRVKLSKIGAKCPKWQRMNWMLYRMANSELRCT